MLFSKGFNEHQVHWNIQYTVLSSLILSPFKSFQFLAFSKFSTADKITLAKSNLSSSKLISAGEEEAGAEVTASAFFG